MIPEDILPMTRLPDNARHEADKNAGEKNVDAKNRIAEEPTHQEGNEERQTDAAYDSPGPEIFPDGLDDHGEEFGYYRGFGGEPAAKLGRSMAATIEPNVFIRLMRQR